MAKLIYSTSLNDFTTAFNGWNNPDSEFYRTVAFTADGYIVTHGKKFRAPIGEASQNPYGLSINTDNGTLTVSLGSGADSVSVTAPVLIGASDGTYLAKSVSNGLVSFSHKTPSEANIANPTSVGTDASTSIDTTAKVLAFLKYDAYGHVVSATARDLVLNRVKGNVATSGTSYYLVGQAASAEGTAEVYKNSNVYFKDGALYASQVYINGHSIADEISASQALYYRGIVDSSLSASVPAENKYKQLPTTGVNVGDLYIVGAGGYTLNAGTASEEVFESGDIIVAVKGSDSGTPSWTGVQRNLQGALTTSNLSASANSGTKLFVKKDTSGNLYVTQNEDINTWRSIKVKGVDFLTDVATALNFAEGSGISLTTNADGTLTIANTSRLADAQALTLTMKNGTNTTSMGTYTPTTARTLIFQSGNNVSLSYADNTLTITSTDTNTKYSHFFGTSAGSDASETANGTTYLTLKSSDTEYSRLQITGSGSVSVSSTGSKLTINGTNTWRTVKAYILSQLTNANDTIDTVLAETIGTDALQFGKDFAWDNDAKEIDLVWAEVTSDSSGNVSVSYHV